VALKCVDLGMQSSQLFQVLETGFPAVLVRGYSVFLACNSLSVALTIISSHHSAMTEVVLDSMYVLHQQSLSRSLMIAVNTVRSFKDEPVVRTVST